MYYLVTLLSFHFLLVRFYHCEISQKVRSKRAEIFLLFVFFFFPFGTMSLDIWGGENNTVTEKDVIFIGSTKTYCWAKCDKCGINGRKRGCFLL